MITIKSTLTAALLAVGLHAQLAAAPAKEEGLATDPEHARLVAARKATNALPEVMSAEQQAKADRALTTKAYAEYKAARKRSTDSEAAYRNIFDASLAKVDEGAPALQEKERAAFRERMLKARTSKKAGAKKPVAKADDDDADDDADDEPASPTKSSN
jgi:hypothetical protein